LPDRGFIDGEYQDGELRGLTFLAGMRGMGKTTEAIRLVDGCGGSVIFFDTVNRHAHLLKGFKVFNEIGPFKAFMVANRGRRVRVCYVPLDEHDLEHLNAVCGVIRALGDDLARKHKDDEGYILAVDEIDSFCGPEHGVKQMPPPLYYLAHYGRHVRTSMLCTARDPPSLSKRFRSQCQFMRLFRVDEDDYVTYFAKRIGKANAEKLPTLQKTYFLLWESGQTEAIVSGGPRKL
jgi:hypothetical protein